MWAQTCPSNLLPLLRPYAGKFNKKPTARDKRRVQKNKLIKEYQMVKKTINKHTGKVQVYLDDCFGLVLDCPKILLCCWDSVEHTG